MAKESKPPPDNGSLRTVEVSQEAAAMLDRMKDRTKIPKRYLVEEAILQYLPKKYGGKKAHA
jgi:predicted transcriptional regulator